MEILEDLDLKKEIAEKRPFLKSIFDESYEGMGVMRLKGQATTWNMQNMAALKTFTDL
jgi:uncharacterized pyridoxamine 5'-phosphate oxidase family protein